MHLTIDDARRGLVGLQALARSIAELPGEWPAAAGDQVAAQIAALELRLATLDLPDAAFPDLAAVLAAMPTAAAAANLVRPRGPVPAWTLDEILVAYGAFATGWRGSQQIYVTLRHDTEFWIAEVWDDTTTGREAIPLERAAAGAEIRGTMLAALAARWAQQGVAAWWPITTVPRQLVLLRATREVIAANPAHPLTALVEHWCAEGARLYADPDRGGPTYFRAIESRAAEIAAAPQRAGVGGVLE